MKKGVVVTQGFIGITTENFTTTLGREGSDYSAAIFSYCLNAESMTIWKDVDGVLNADPRIFSKVTLLDKISYQEAIEMTYYGAQVIHPKTLRPLQNKNIPLFVKSFIHPDQKGTIVSTEENTHYPPVFVVKPNQVLLKISSKSFHFIDEIRFANLFEAFAKFKIKVNMTQNTALAFSVAVNFDESRIAELTNYLSNEYDIEMIGQLKLLTIRHGNEEIVQKISDGKTIYLEEKIKGNVQLLMKENEILE
jgi:aspartate kinase